MANFAVWHYLNYGHGLRCAWNEQHSAEIGIQAFDAIYYTHWRPFLSLSLQHVNLVGAKNLLLYTLSLGLLTVLNMKPLGGGGHSVVAFGYKKTSDTTIEFYCYDVNNPLVQRTIMCSRSYGLWVFYYPESPGSARLHQSSSDRVLHTSP